jgi:Rrf2 family iron-sulfur cluster assembly transcriptional regulator
MHLEGPIKITWMFSKATEYALRATIYIAQKSTEEKKLGLIEIAKAIDSPKSFTAKILQLLTKEDRIISSSTGPGGGFYLEPAKRKLPVRAVLEAVGEDDVITKCILGLRECSDLKPCPMHARYKIIKLQLIQLFETKTIQDLADEISKGKLFINNNRKSAAK